MQHVCVATAQRCSSTRLGGRPHAPLLSTVCVCVCSLCWLQVGTAPNVITTGVPEAMSSPWTLVQQAAQWSPRCSMAVLYNPADDNIVIVGGEELVQPTPSPSPLPVADAVAAAAALACGFCSCCFC